MTEPRDLSPQDEDDALAAEFVLGVLELEARLAAESRIKTDPAFAARVQAWENHFADLNDGYEAAVAPDLMPEIEARIFGRKDQPKRSFWGLFAGAATAAVLALALIALFPSGPTGPVLTATLAGEATDLAFEASYSDGALTLARTAGGDPATDLDYELWVIVGDAAPVSLGLLTGAQTSKTLEPLPPGAVLAVSLEPKGGSPTGAPTGPVLVTGVVASS